MQPEIDPDLPAFTADAGYYYSLISLSYPDRVASIDRSASHIGAAVILENPIEDYYAQQWSIQPISDGGFRFYNHFARCVMQSRGANTPVVVERINEEAHTQLWFHCRWTKIHMCCKIVPPAGMPVWKTER